MWICPSKIEATFSKRLFKIQIVFYSMLISLKLHRSPNDTFAKDNTIFKNEYQSTAQLVPPRKISRKLFTWSYSDSQTSLGPSLCLEFSTKRLMKQRTILTAEYKFNYETLSLLRFSKVRDSPFPRDLFRNL